MSKQLDPIIEEAMNQLKALGSARRGQLSEQFFVHKTADGRSVRRGPYYVWQRWVKGRKRSVRIPAPLVAQVRADLRRGKQVQAIFDQVFARMEGAAGQQDTAAKKKWSNTPGAAKRRRPST